MAKQRVGQLLQEGRALSKRKIGNACYKKKGPVQRGVATRDGGEAEGESAFA